MTSTDEQNTIENAAGVADGVDGAPQPGDADAGPEQKPPSKRAAAKKAAADKKAAETEAAEDRDVLALPAGLRTDGHTDSGGGEHRTRAIVHVYEFDNGYGAKVYQRERGGPWEWAPLDGDGRVVRHLDELGRVPAQATIAKINDGLALVAALDA